MANTANIRNYKFYLGLKPINYEINRKSISNGYTFSKQSDITLNMIKNVDDIDDRGVIEVPADAQTVIYQDEDGQYYEVNIDELKEYDGDDGEITYHQSSLSQVKTIKHNKRIKKRMPVMPILQSGVLYNRFIQRLR